MSEIIKIKKGLMIKLQGESNRTVSELNSLKYALKPTDFIGVFPKLNVKEGDKVKAGSPVFFDKYRDNIQFTSPVSGTVSEIKRGAKRVLLEIRIEADSTNDFVDFGAANPANIDGEAITEKLLQSGLWSCIRQRPYSVIADPTQSPKAIFISGFDNAPLAVDYDYVLHNKGEVFQTGLDALAKLTKGKLHLNLHANDTQTKVLLNSKNVEINLFKGKHPASLVGTQIAAIDPINKDEVVWTVNVQDVLTIGNLFLKGKYDTEKIISFGGSEVLKPHYYRAKAGVSIQDMVSNNVAKGNLRYISGNALTGTQIESTGYLGFYDNQISVIPEGDHSQFIGWIMPNLGKFSFYRSLFSWLMPKKSYRLDTNLNGGARAFVMTGQFEKVFPFDIYPMQLIKAIMSRDIDAMENLGIYEVAAEDFALIEFISTSKIDIQSVVAEGLEFLRKEMS
ncbi:MAG: Na(+)-translocating NADH-quinone reductase subunit A [Bacteroidales bacterium]|jgi:Na+-transporting NADH:ubiquinone oxidoreductase subunit A|nr:Na(+)-translocating NADH-quinone reductase subunit A [Bacteroidales bacterium]